MSELTSLLVRDGVVPVRKVEEALQRQVMSGGDLETVLLELGLVDENVLAGYRAAVFDLPPASREQVMDVPSEVLRLVPVGLAAEHEMVPLGAEGGVLHLAVHRTLTPERQREIGALLGHELALHVACEARIASALVAYFGVELEPRMKRLVQRLDARPPGEVPVVRRLVDDDVVEFASSAGRASRPPHGLGPRGSNGLNLEIAPDGADDADSRAREAPPVPLAEEVPAERAEPAGSASLGALSSSLPPPGRRAPVDEQDEERPRGFRRFHGPLTLERGERMLQRARNRDEILEVLFAFAAQFFDYTVLFVVQDDVADGRAACGPGLTTSEVAGITFSLSEPSLFADVRRTKAAIVRRLNRTPAERAVTDALRRPHAPPVMLVPLAIRGRVVLIMYGDRGGEEFEVGSAMELVRFVPRVVEAFEHLILRGKRARSDVAPASSDVAPASSDVAPASSDVAPASSDVAPASSDVAPASSDVAPASSGAAARSGSAPPPRDRAGGTPSQQRSEFKAPDGEDGEDSWRAVAKAPAPLTPSRGSSGAAAAPRTEAPRAEYGRRGASELPPARVLGLPRRAPPPPSSGSLDLEVANDDFAVTFGVPRRAPSSPEAIVAAEVPAEVAAGASSPAGESGAPAGDDGASDRGEPQSPEAEPELGADASSASGSASTADEPPTAPAARPSERPASLGSYSVQDAAVDVLRPRRRTNRPPRRVSERPGPGRGSLAEPAPSAPRSSPPRKSSSPPARRSSRPPPGYGDSEVIRVPKELAMRPAPEPPSARHSEPPRGMDSETRSVIVDMGASLHELVRDLADSVERGRWATAVDRLMDAGHASLPLLVQAFPGALAWRRGDGGIPPAGRDLSGVAMALVTFGERAASYLEGLLDSAHPDVRYYALMVASELIYPEVLPALAARVHDPDEENRALALELLPRFVGLAGWESVLTVLRRTARIRGKDLSRRRQAVDAVAAVRDAEMVPKLIELLLEDDEELMAHLQAALRLLTTQDYGRSHRRWDAWWQRNRARHRVQWLIDGLLHADEWVRKTAGEEIKRLTGQYYGYHPTAPRRDREWVAKKYREWWLTEGKRAF